jgi:glycosyltransferase involved in cell wall biosynthesis
MRLLICTQAVDRRDPVLGFFHGWIEAFARNCEHVYVICLFEGEHALPANVTVLSLGKETRGSRIQYLRRFFHYLWQYRREYDAVFVHMNQIYVLLGGLFWRLSGKRIVLWYAHGAVSFSLRIAEKLAQAIVTSTSEGFRLLSKKVRVVGQGIDTSLFGRCPPREKTDEIRIVYVGRISPIKRCEVLIEALAVLRERGEDASVTLVGDTNASNTREYHASLQKLVQDRGLAARVTFTGGVPHERIVSYLCAADVFANPSATGSLDKAGVEALAAGVPVVTSNEAFKGMLGAYADRLMFPNGDADALADRIAALHRAPDRQALTDALSEAVRKEHSVDSLIPRILAVLDRE